MRFVTTIFLCLIVTPALARNASHYGAGDGYYGKRTACGTIHRPGNTTAHRSLPCGTKVKITNRANGRSGIVTVTDRGPHVAGRIWDLNSSFARSIGCGGSCNVSGEVLRGPKP
jgi:rare lipoprotein A